MCRKAARTGLWGSGEETNRSTRKIQNIIETPLFVDSSLTSMIQMADLCGYALRRYLENNETILFDEVFKRADRRAQTVVGVRHFSTP